MWTRGLVLASIFALSPTVTSAEVESDTLPADVMVSVARFANDLETVRLYMGRPAVTPSRFRVEFTAPRHDFFQTQTLFRKVNRLGSEVAGLTRQSPPPAAEHHAIAQSDVLRAVAHAQSQLDLIRESLGIDTQSPPPKRNPRIDSKDVFEELAQINRQLNLMIDDSFRSSDVFSQLFVTNVYLAGVLERTDREPFPTVPFVSNKQPIDVYELLVDCLDLNQRIGERIGIEVLQINARRLKSEHLVLSDNYDLATILLSDVAFWSVRLDHSEDVLSAHRGSEEHIPSARLRDSQVNSRTTQPDPEQHLINLSSRGSATHWAA